MSRRRRQVARHCCRTHGDALPAVRHNPIRGMALRETHGAHGTFNFSGARTGQKMQQR